MKLGKIGKRRMNRRGQQIMVTLLFLFLAVATLIALLPAFVSMIDSGKQSDSLNCAGFVYNGDANNPLSYNATIGTKSTIGCLAINLYLPYIVLGCLIAGVGALFYRQVGGQQQQYYGGQ
jgi:hypothetical protein